MSSVCQEKNDYVAFHVAVSLYIKDIFLLKEIHKSILQLNREFMQPYFTNKDMYYSLIKGPTLGLPKTQQNAVHFPGFSIMEYQNKVQECII